jgi:DNA polymerase-1
MVRRMEDVGLLADLKHFQDLSFYLTDLLDQKRQEIHAIGGPENPGSPDQISDWVYGRLHAKSKGRKRSTDKKYFEALAKDPKTRPDVREACERTLEYRQIATLKTRYVDPMPSLLGADGRLHARILYTRTDTGRLAAKGWEDDDGEDQGANVLAFPKHSDLGLLVRHGFVPGRGRCIAEWDLDQAEMRMMAADSGDQLMISEINSGLDKHTSTASNVIYHRPPETISKHERFTAKAVNFGVLMGITENGLTDQLRKNGMQITEAECRKFLTDWMKGYPGCASYIAGKHAEARRHGYVTNWRGRRRWLPAVHSPDEHRAAEALRQAQATPIQGGAQEIAKLWMVSVYERVEKLRAAGIWIELLLQVHDSLLFELDEWAYEILDQEIREALEEHQYFPVPITCSGGGRGATWGEA